MTPARAGEGRSRLPVIRENCRTELKFPAAGQVSATACSRGAHPQHLGRCLHSRQCTGVPCVDRPRVSAGSTSWTAQAFVNQAAPPGALSRGVWLGCADESGTRPTSEGNPSRRAQAVALSAGDHAGVSSLAAPPTSLHTIRLKAANPRNQKNLELMPLALLASPFGQRAENTQAAHHQPQ